MNFTDKVVWITGASSGIGKALALELSKQHAKIIISSRNEEKLKAVKEQCSYSENVKILPLDLADHIIMNDKVTEALQLFGSLNILINNGGISQRSLAIETQLSVDKKLFDINYFGTVALTKAVLPYFVKQKAGHIVTITSVVGKIGTPLRSSYAASKHALHGFFDSLRAEVFKDNIAVTLVCPGFVRTDVSKNALTADGSPQNKMDNATDAGLSPVFFARKMLKTVATQKQEVVIGGTKEKLAVYVKRFFPVLLSKMIRKASVT
jgi:short-subunit dehydrogenase